MKTPRPHPTPTTHLLKHTTKLWTKRGSIQSSHGCNHFTVTQATLKTKCMLQLIACIALSIMCDQKHIKYKKTRSLRYEQLIMENMHTCLVMYLMNKAKHTHIRAHAHTQTHTHTHTHTVTHTHTHTHSHTSDTATPSLVATEGRESVSMSLSCPCSPTSFSAPS